MPQVDLNCDMGESFGYYVLGNDEVVLNYVSSANIACGFHAGDPRVMRRTVHAALEKGVAIGAHPGYRDLQGFGRRFMQVSAEDAENLILYQIGALAAFVNAEGGHLHHVKPHGALYNAAAVDASLADAIARAVFSIDPDLILFGLSGTELIRAGERFGIRTANEAFADRTYQPNGTLTPRGHPEAVIYESETAIEQTLRLITEGKVRSPGGADVEVEADTICIHGDSPHALAFARLIRERLVGSGIEVTRVAGRARERGG